MSGFLPSGELCRPLFIAPRLASAADQSEIGEFYPIYHPRQASLMFGPGSVAALMAQQWHCTCPEQPLYIAPVDDDPAGTRAVHTITVSGPATDNGVLSIAVLDEVFAVGVIVGTTAAQIATALAASLSRWRELPFDVTVGSGNGGSNGNGAGTNVVRLTAKNAGPVGNWFSPIINPQFGDALPAGVGLEMATETVGVGVVDVEPMLRVLDCAFDCVATGFEDERAINTIIQVIRQNWRCGTQGDFKAGHLFHSKTATAGVIAAYGMDRNAAEETVVPVRTGYKYPGYLFAAAAATRVCCNACTDPSRPVQYDAGVLGCLYDARRCTSVWTKEEKMMFYDAGILNWDVSHTRGVRQTALWIEEPLTTWKWDPATGAPDGAWQRVESRYTVAKFVRDLGYYYRRHFASTSLVNDGFQIPTNKRAVNPSILRSSILSWLKGTQLGWTADMSPVPLEQMVRVERTNQPNFCDPNRVNVLIDLDLVNQLARIATTIDTSPEFACLPTTQNATPALV